MHDVHIWGDSHWRNWFMETNHGPPGVTCERDGIRTIDMCANELAGATMYGLLNENSKNGARRRILGDLDRMGGVENAGLVFGEVDCRYPQHHDRYFRPDGTLMMCEVMNLITRYRRFIEEDLLASGRVRGRVFPYFGFAYPKGAGTLLQPSQPMGPRALVRATTLMKTMTDIIGDMLTHGCSLRAPWGSSRIVPIVADADTVRPMVSSDGVHLVPQMVYEGVTLPALVAELSPVFG